MTIETNMQNEWGDDDHRKQQPAGGRARFEKGGTLDPEFWRQFYINRERVRRLQPTPPERQDNDGT